MKNKILEALLFVQGNEGLSSEQAKNVFKLNTIQEARRMLKDFRESFNKQERGIKVHEFNDVYKFMTIEAVKDAISELVTITRKRHLSDASIEVAGIVAYKQPVTRSMISNIRGVISDSIVQNLLTKGIIEEVGVASTPGNPILYGITNKFYDYFKIKTLAELPPFPEFSQYSDEDEVDEKDFNLFDSQRQDTDKDGILTVEAGEDD
ncbi:segregation and condensation protein B [Metamycoplasma arthritidis]|uniref:Segregation and condensation protein B n=1 Tax=Metamycoplasma arthritidis (strain 158L3-1) TaxID=243272 RepID=B3PLS6_META1|nr:SMC-Scp complex subunit ScpB [Metamycoplasma arthritidis]ACF06978.1 segregation and condensation protein B [Metamycoplasma arthritidis 158L3-1]VEU78507.1 segregation and condensation protein B [Metamycoplasma arthritidis]